MLSVLHLKIDMLYTTAALQLLEARRAGVAGDDVASALPSKDM